MKKILFATLFCLVTSYTAQAQTKEETITWLQEKLKKYIIPEKAEFLTIAVTECYITIKYAHSVYDNRGELSQFFNNEYYIIPTSGIIIGSRIKMRDDIESIRVKLDNDNEHFRNWVHFEITNGEENLYPRLQKAVDHLATFCPKKQETF